MRNLQWELEHGFRHNMGPDAGDIARMQKDAEDRAEEQAEIARAQELEDRAFFRAEAETERASQEARAAKLAKRKTVEEKSRIKSLSEAEQEASEEATAVSGKKDPDQSFGNMFAALLSGMTSNARVSGTSSGLRKFNLPSSKRT